MEKTTKRHLKLVDQPCQYGYMRSTCDSIEPELVKLGRQGLAACTSCEMPQVTEMLATVGSKPALKALTKLGFLRPDRPPLETDVRCVVHGEEIVTDCEMVTCGLYTTYPKVANCMLVYMTRQNLQALEPLDISLLTGTPVKVLQREIATAMSALRNGTLETTATRDLEPTHLTLGSLQVCACCEKPVSDLEPEAISGMHSDQIFWYCSSVCVEEKPLAVVAVEAMCQADIQRALRWVVARYENTLAIEQALNMDRWTLNAQLQKHLGVSAEDLNSPVSASKQKPGQLTKRTGQRPDWLATFYDMPKKVLRRMVRSYGKPTIDLNDLYLEVEEILISW